MTNEKKPVGQVIPLSGWTRGKIVCSRGGARYRARGSTDHLLLAVGRKCISSEEFGTWGNTIPMGMWDTWRSQPWPCACELTGCRERLWLGFERRCFLLILLTFTFAVISYCCVGSVSIGPPARRVHSGSTIAQKKPSGLEPACRLASRSKWNDRTRQRKIKENHD